MTKQDLLKLDPQQLGQELLSKEDIQSLLNEMPNWYLMEDPARPLTIGSGFDFNDFNESIDFVNYIADFADEQNHHPDILVHEFNKVSLFVTTHEVGGVTMRDLYWAAKLDDVLNKAISEAQTQPQPQI